MKFSEAIDLYVVDQRVAGRINSDRTEVAYRGVLDRHRVDVGNRDPRTIGREDCKRTLAHWPNPNTQRCSRSILVAFYDWTLEEGIRDTNPARQTRRPKRRPTTVYRLTGGEAIAMLDACETIFERRAIFLGLCAGLRSAELRNLQGLHFERDGLIWVSADIAKGARERWVPILEQLEPIVDDIRATVAPAHFVLPGQYVGGGSHGSGQVRREHLDRGCSSQHLQRTVHRIAARAGITAHVHPHLLRHAFADHRRAPRRSRGRLLGIEPSDPRKIDHVNGNTLDNRRHNLRVATTALNAQNQGSRGGSSRHRGVSWCNTRQKWFAQAQLDGRKINLGRYATEQEAADAAAEFRARHMPFSLDAKETKMSDHLLVANRVPLDGEAEAEPILVNTDDDRVVVLTLDGGERIELDRRELDAALEAA